MRRLPLHAVVYQVQPDGEAVQAVEQVSEVYSTSGEYDLLIKCYLPEAADIGHFVTEHVQTLPGVKDTFTIIAFKAFT